MSRGGSDVKEGSQEEEKSVESKVGSEPDVESNLLFERSIGYPFVLLESEPQREPQKPKAASKPTVYPIGYPATLMILSCVMWGMWWVGLVFAASGLTYRYFARCAYWSLLLGYDFSAPEPRKPPDPSVRRAKGPRGKQRMLLLALQVALRIQQNVPSIDLSSSRQLRRVLHKRTFRNGLLNTLRLSSDERACVMNAVEQFPMELI